MPIAQHSCIFPGAPCHFFVLGAGAVFVTVVKVGPAPAPPLVTLGHTEVADLITQPTLANDRLYFLSFCLVSSLGTCPAQTGPVWNQYKIAHVRIDQ